MEAQGNAQRRFEGELELESAIGEIGREIDAAFPARTRHPLRRMEERVMTRVAGDRELRAAMFRFVDVAPACRSLGDLGRHLIEHLDQIEKPPAPLGAAVKLGRGKILPATLGAVARLAVRRMAHRFIVGRTPEDAARLLRRLWRHGAASSLDLLGEATLTRSEADLYASRCSDALRALSAGSSRWPARAQLEADSAGPLPRANLSVKLTALTPLLRAHAPEVGAREAEPRLRDLLRLARELEAHLHIDMESFDTRETTLGLVLRLLGEQEFERGPDTGVVLQAYLRDSEQELERILDWAREHERATPLVLRLVKGAYWDQEVTLARQHGWTPPVYTDKAACDASFERLTRTLLEARPLVRVAVASHNLRSVSHAIACSRALGSPDQDLELQVLRGLGDDLRQALAKLGFRVRVYCPVGDLVEGMAYLVRRLLENTSNESFLYRRAAGQPLDELLAPPEPAAVEEPEHAPYP
jgi:proline dehydrogenase